VTTPESVINDIVAGASNRTFHCNSPTCKMENVKLIQITFFDVNELHYEQTRTGFAAITDSGEILIYDHYHTGKYARTTKSKEKIKTKKLKNSSKQPSVMEFADQEEVYIPLVNPQTLTGQIVLPGSPEICNSVADILTEIENKIEKWLYISPEEWPIFRVQLRVAVASWFLYVYDSINIMERVAGLLSIVGTSGGGKKRWLTVMRQISYRPIYLLNTSKIPSVFRMAEPWGAPTLLIDEADQKDTGSETEWIQFVNARYDGTPTPRFNASTNRVDTFRSFGLTALALRRMPKDEGTTSRMVKINATISPEPLPEVAGEDIFNEFESIRNRLLYLRLKYFGKLKFVGSSGLPADQSWRGKETLTLFRILEQMDPAISVDISRISQDLTAREVENLSQTWDGLIINEIFAFISEDGAEFRARKGGFYCAKNWTDKTGAEHTSYLNLKFLADRLGVSASEIQRSMAQFKIATYERFRPDGDKRQQRGILMFAHPRDTDRIFMRYVPGYDHGLARLGSQKKITDDKKNFVPPVPGVPPHDLPTDLFNNNNNNNTTDIHAPGTPGTPGTESNNITSNAYNSESPTGPLNSSLKSENENNVSSITLETGSTNMDLKNSPKMRDSDHVAESNANPEKSGVRSEKYPISEKEGKLIIDQLLNLGYHIDPNSGPDINQKFFVIRIAGFNSLSSDMKEKLLFIMAKEHFTMATGGYHSVAFARSLASASDNAGHSPQSDPESIRYEIVETIRTEAPKTQYGAMTPEAVHRIIGARFKDITPDKIKELCDQEYDKGTLIRRGPGYYYNWEGA
jgi:hypothetical protein